MNCKKCGSTGTVVLRKREYYCNSCFVAATNHKFRACLGKNKIIRANDKSLICISGGPASTVMLDLIHSGISMDSHKQLRVIPKCLHLQGTNSKDIEHSHSLLETCQNYKIDLYVVNIAEYFAPDFKLPKKNCIPTINEHLNLKYLQLLRSMPASVRNDFVLKIQRELYIKSARELQCKFVFTAETTTTLAIKLLSNLAIGRGSQVQNDIGFLDTRDDAIKILRPMREISDEDLQYYIKIRNLSFIEKSEINKNSLQSVIGTFVTDLQHNFQSTISTVCKTADKIGLGDVDNTKIKCVFCQSLLNEENRKLSALHATNLSRTVSLQEPCQEMTLENIEQTMHNSMFPFIGKELCYSCSRNYSEIDSSSLPKHIQESIPS